MSTGVRRRRRSLRPSCSVPSLVMMCPTWCSTVRLLRNSRSAICWLDSPSTTSRRTSRSRCGESCPERGGGTVGARTPSVRRNWAASSASRRASRVRKTASAVRRFGHREGRLVGSVRAGDREPAASGLVGQPRPGEGAQRRLQMPSRRMDRRAGPRPSSASAAHVRERRSPTRAARSRPSTSAASLQRKWQAARSSAEQRQRGGVLHASTGTSVEGAAQHGVSHLELTPREVQPWPVGRRPAASDSLPWSSRAGLRVPALPDAQPGQPDRRARPQRAHARVVEPEGRRSALPPPRPSGRPRRGCRRSTCGRSPRPRGRWMRAQRAFGDVDPLLGAAHVEGQLAAEQHLAVDLPDDEMVPNLSGRAPRAAAWSTLAHALGDAPRRTRLTPCVAERTELPDRCRRRGVRSHGGCLHVGVDHVRVLGGQRLGQLDPAGLRAFAGLVGQAPGPRQPAAGDGERCRRRPRGGRLSSRPAISAGSRVSLRAR